MNRDSTLTILHRASTAAGLNSDGAEVIRLAENSIYRLRDGIVARIARAGQDAAATKEVNVARWLEDSGVPAVRIMREIDQPVRVDGRSVTFWHELPPHEYGAIVDVAAALRELHKLPPPEVFELPNLAPFVRLPQRIEAATDIKGTVLDAIDTLTSDPQQLDPVQAADLITAVKSPRREERAGRAGREAISGTSPPRQGVTAAARRRRAA